MKKDKKQKLSLKNEVVQETGISKLGRKIILISIFTLVLGFFLLKFTNPEGNNWASRVAPIVIILSYIFIAVGIMIR